MYRGCIFDLDGTLTDTLESLTFSVNAMLERLKMPSITMDQCRQFVGNGARVLVEKALEAAGGRDEALTERGLEVYRQIFAENCTYHVKPYEGILPMLGELKQRGIPAAVVSNKPHRQAVDVVEAVLGSQYFGSVSGQREGIERKPDPAGVFAAAKGLGVRKEDCLYIGDSEVDMETAKRAGILCAGVTWGFRSREVLEEAGADYIIDHPYQLLDIIKEEA